VLEATGLTERLRVPEQDEKDKDEKEAKEVDEPAEDFVELISRRNVVYPLPSAVQTLLQNGADSARCLPLEDGVIKLRASVAEGQLCSCDLPLPYKVDSDHYFLCADKTTVYFPREAVQVKMLSLRCQNSNSKCTVHFQGDQHALRVCTFETIVAEVIFANCFSMVRAVIHACFNFTQARTSVGSVAGFHDFQKEQYTIYRSACAFLTEDSFRKFYYAWLFTARAENPAPKQCPRCGSSPTVLSCDGSRLLLLRPTLSFVQGLFFRSKPQTTLAYL